MTVKKLKELLAGFDDAFIVTIFNEYHGETLNIYAVELNLDDEKVILK